MITKIKVEYFKRFPEETFLLGDNIVLAGPNNSGKTSLLQAISVWNLGLQKWLAEHSESSKAKQRTGVPITRKDFTALPLREMNLLWSNRDTAYGKEERPGSKAGQPKLVNITVWGVNPGDEQEWNVSVTFRYQNKELVHVKLMDENNNILVDVPPAIKQVSVVHVPPFSGIGAEETGLNPGYQNMLVGQGKPGDVLRNLLFEVYAKGEREKSGLWSSFVGTIRDLFGYELLDPQYHEMTDPFIRIEYQHRNSRTRYDIASAGSGFHQVLTLLGFFYARPASVLLLDEPDAHLHVILQRQVYDQLRAEARRSQCQLLVSTHSEVILEDTGPEQILSFYGPPHRIQVQIQRDQVREALKRLSSLHILSAESGQDILYLEDESDFKILAEFARILDHPMKDFFDKPFFYPIHGRDAREAKAHFFGLKAIRPATQGILLLDGDNRNLPDHELAAENLLLLRWRRYEIENYLLHPDSLLRFVQGHELDLFSAGRRTAGEEFLKGNLPPAAFTSPLVDMDYLVATPAGKTLLPTFLDKAGVRLSKKDYYQIAATMNPKELHPEIREKLDEMAKVLIPRNAGNDET